LALALWSVGCQGDSVPARIDLAVRGGPVGTVRVGEQSADLVPRGVARLVDVGEGPYTVHLDLADERLTLLEVPGPELDLAFFAPTPRSLIDQQTDLCFEPNPREGFEVAAFDGALRLPVTDDDGLCVSAPLDRPVEVVALWRSGAALARPHFARRSIESVRRTAVWPIEPDAALDERLAIAIDGTPPATITVELTFDDVRTGLLVGGGLATPGNAVGVPRPPPGPHTEGLALRVEAGARAVGQRERVAEIALQVPLDRDGVTLAWPARVLASPAPRVAESALQIRREPPLVWGPDLADASWLEISLEADDGCTRRRWRVVTPASSGALALPEWPEGDGDPLAAPILRGRLSRVDIVGREYAELLAPGAPSPVTRAVAARVARRAAVGAWRGGPPSCEADPRAGVYALHVGDTCEPFGAAPRVLIGRCGAIVGLDREASAYLGCRRLDGDAARGSGETWWVTGDEDGLDITRPDGVLRLVPLDIPSGVAAPAAILGDWFELVGTRERFDRHEGQSLDGGPVPFVTGTAGEGPWLHVDASGRFELEAGALSLSAQMVEFDGLCGTLLAVASPCRDAPRMLTMCLEDEGLAFEERAATDEETDEVRIYRLGR